MSEKKTLREQILAESERIKIDGKRVAIVRLRDIPLDEIDALQAENEDLCAEVDEAGKENGALQDALEKTEAENGRLKKEVNRLHLLEDEAERHFFDKEWGECGCRPCDVIRKWRKEEEVTE